MSKLRTIELVITVVTVAAAAACSPGPTAPRERRAE
jgi:hypothetical protein